MIEQNVFFIVVGLFVALSCRDLFATTSTKQPIVSNKDIHDDHQMNLDTDIGVDSGSKATFEPNDQVFSADNLRNVGHSPVVKILYCHSCGYKNAYSETVKLLSQKYPHFHFVGGLHQPSWLRSQLVQLLFIFKVVTLGLIFFNVNPFTYFGMATPQIWTYITERKMYASMLIFFLTQIIESNLMSTGAFEIYYNDIPIWSKVESGRMPSPYELIQTIDAQANFYQKSKIPHDFIPPT